MFRWLAVLIVLAGGTFALMAMLVGPNSTAKDRIPTDRTSQVKVPQPGDDSDEPLLQPPSRTPDENRALPEPRWWTADSTPVLQQATPIPNCTLSNIEQQEVPSQKEGVVLFIGTIVKRGDPPVPPEKLIKDRLDPTQDPQFNFLAVEASPDDANKFHIKGDTKTWYRLWRPGDEPEPGKVVLVGQRWPIRKLQVGDEVKRGDLIAMINPSIAFSELAIAVAELDAADAEYRAAGKAKDIAQIRFEAYSAASPGSISKDEMAKARLDALKGVEDEKVKHAAIRSAQAKLNKAATTLEMHEVRAQVSGRIRDINKNMGDAIKPLEPLVLIQNPDLLRIEGLLEVQEAVKLKRGTIVEVEPTRPESPTVLGNHLGPVTCVAVSGTDKPIVISGGEDLTLRGWELATGRRWRQELYSTPKTLACTPAGTEANLLAVGDTAGVIRLFDLGDSKGIKVVREMDERHQGAVLSVAFSPDGRLCASGGTDRALCLWDTASGKLLHRQPVAHRNEITAVQFLKAEDKDAKGYRLLTASRDNTLALWQFVEGSGLVRKDEGKDRSGDVTFPGVSPDGKYVLFDQGRDLRVLSLDDKHSLGRLSNPSDAASFAGMALFAPDGKTILTNGSAAGRLQLWRAPTARNTRAAELRQFIWSGQATCGAFAPNSKFVVTGTQDNQVLVWAMPSPDEVDEVKGRLTAELSLVEQALNTGSSRQVRVWAELKNPGWLIAGQRATLVVPPQAEPRR
jgi:WD40 repeat protein